MKFIILVSVMIVCANAAFEKEFKEKAMKKIQEAGSQCAKKEKANEEDIKELLAKKMPSRKEGKCLLSCFYQAFDAQDAEGKFTMEGAMKSIEPFKAADAEIHGQMKQIYEKCIPEAQFTGDRCETAIKMAACAKKASEEIGLTEQVLM